MDEAVKKTLVLALMAIASAGAAAQALQDPTRPPAAAAAGHAAAVAQPASGPQLQSVLAGRAPGGRHLAVIDGETVRLGEQFHGARVTRIGENEVELLRGRERQVLRLYAADSAGSGMTPVARAAGLKSGALAAQR
jgi:MSHA biogenesis protein MshK